MAVAAAGAAGAAVAVEGEEGAGAGEGKVRGVGNAVVDGVLTAGRSSVV